MEGVEMTSSMGEVEVIPSMVVTERIAIQEEVKSRIL